MSGQVGLISRDKVARVLVGGNILPKVQPVVLPRDLPHEAEEHCISIICESDRLKWNFHDGKHKFAPTVFWVTSHVEAGDRSLPPCLALSRFLCRQAKNYMFGDDNVKSATKQNASRIATKRKVPSITVYILSNNATHEADIAFLFQSIPARLFKLSNTDFFTSEELGVMTSPLISVGQYAAMFALKIDYGSPVLLFNGGTAVTYIAMDKESKLLGGGACPGIAIRCRTLFDYCSEDFPSISFDKYKRITNKAKSEKKPISLFSSNLEEGVIANATAEMAGQLRNIVKQFIKTVGPSIDTTEAPKVVITGEDSDTEILVQLLKENCSNLVVPEPDVTFPPSTKDMICVRKNMAAYGIQHILVTHKKKKAPRDPDDILRENIIGIRAAKVSQSTDLTGCNTKTIQRGSIVRIIPGKIIEDDTIVLLTDEGDEVILDSVQLFESMFLYSEVGEECKELDKADWVEEKRKASTKVVGDLVGKNNKIQKRKEELDAIKKKEGSVVNMLSTSGNDKRGEKRPRPTPKKEDNPEKYISQRIAKYFEMPHPENVNQIKKVLFIGTIDSISHPSNLNLLWHVRYDDGDEEEYDFRELRAGILLYAKEKGPDKPS